MGESTARIWRSTYESQEHSIMVTLATQMRQPAACGAGSTEILALWLSDIAFDATIGPEMDRQNRSVSGICGDCDFPASGRVIIINGSRRSLMKKMWLCVALAAAPALA